MDQSLLFLINGCHCPYADAVMFLVSGKTAWIGLYAVLLLCLWRRCGWQGAVAALAMIGAGMLITDWGNAHLLRPAIGRLRPSNPDNPIAPLVHTVYGMRGAGCGFPSAHAANVWLLAAVCGYWLRDRPTRTALAAVALLVCYSRVYLGYHYPGDIAGGFLLAAVTAAPIIYVAHRLRQPAVPVRHRRNRRRPQQQQHGQHGQQQQPAGHGAYEAIFRWLTPAAAILTTTSFLIAATFIQ